MISNGIDLAEIKRFDELKNDPKFMNHFFLEGELEYIKKSNNSSSTIAGIYSAKEAFLKAIKKGIFYICQCKITSLQSILYTKPKMYI